MSTNKHYQQVKDFLISDANTIQKLATVHNKKFIGGTKFRSEVIMSYQYRHIEIVKGLAEYLEDDLKNGLRFFKRQATELAQQAVKDKLTLQETIDGVIFLKQAIWQSVHDEGLLDTLTTQDYYNISQTMGTYIDVVSSVIAYIYHKSYIDKEDKINKKLKEISQNKDEFIGAATHELRTPVTALKGYAQVLQRRFERAGDLKSAEHLSKMDAQLNRLNHLIGDLLDVTKIESGKLKFQLSTFDFDQLIYTTFDALQQTTDRHTIVVEGKTNKKVQGDSERIAQVLANILSNAIKYSPFADKIVVGLQEKDGQVICSVQDLGVGIPPSKQQKIFQRFYRVPGTQEVTFPGLGLGLYICAEIIKRHGGNIWVKSNKPQGSIFYFCLPLKKGKVRQQQNTIVHEETKHD